MTNYRKIIIVLLCLLSLAGNIFAKDIQQHPKLIKGTLKNGLTYYIYPNDYPRGEAIYRLFIKSGSVNETEDQRGLAHFLEHMAFNGTKHFPGNSLVKFLESKGAKFGRDLNAHTSYNETVYKLRLPTNTEGIVDTTLTILADWLDGLLLEDNDIDAERGVIMSEWLSKQKPGAEVNDVLLDVLMNGSIYSQRKVIGDTAVIQYCDYQAIRDYYKAWYEPNNSAVAIVGDVDPILVQRLINEKFAEIPNHRRIELEPCPIPDYDQVKANIVLNEDLKKVELTAIQLVPRSNQVRVENDFYPYLQRIVLNRLFNNRLNSLSFSNHDYVSGSIGLSDFLNAKGVLMASVELMPNKVEEGASLFISQLFQIYRYGFLSDEIDKVKKTLLRSKERSAVSVQPISSSKLIEEIYADFFKGYTITTPKEEYRLIEKYISLIDSVSLVQALHKLVKPNHTNYIFSTFEENRLTDSIHLLHFIDSIQNLNIVPYQLQIDAHSRLLESEPEPGYILEERNIPFLKGIELYLSNGVRVIYKKAVSSKNRISISAFKKGGLFALDSIDYLNGVFAPGIVSLSGAGDFSRDELSYYMAGNSASVRLLIENARSGMVGNSSSDDIESLFQLMYLKWTQPKADLSVFELTKNKFIENYRNKNVTEETVFYRDLNYLIKGVDYVTREMTDSIIEKRVHFESILPIFQSVFGDAQGFTFVIISDIEIESLKPYINRYIGSLPSSNRVDSFPLYVYDGGNIKTTASELIRPAGDSERAVVSLIFQHTNISDSIKYYDLKSKILSDVLRSKLLSVLREQMGMVYSVNVSAGSRKYPSALARNTISFATNPQNYELLIKEIKIILKDMSENPHSYDSELKNVKLSLINDMKVNFQSDSYWSSFIRNSIFNENEDWSYISNFQDIVNCISNEEISNFLKNYYNTNYMIEAVLLPKNSNYLSIN